jgi:hypothetical protein
MFKRIVLATFSALFLLSGIIAVSGSKSTNNYAEPVPTPTLEGTPVKPPEPKPSTKPTI